MCVYVFTKINFWPELYENTIGTSKEDILITKELKYLIKKTLIFIMHKSVIFER